MINSADICSYLKKNKYEYTYIGKEIDIKSYCSLGKPNKNAVTWIKAGNPTELNGIVNAETLLFIVDRQDMHVYGEEHHLILCDNPKEVFFSILREFFVIKEEPIIQKDSFIETEHIGNNVSIGHRCYISKDVIIGNNVVIKNNVCIECPTVIGDNTIISSGVVIGTTGFGYYKKEDGMYEGVPHLGGVKIGDNVEIGANTCIDRGTLDNTIIGDNVKIDNLCHIGHNAVVEKNALVIALSLLGGSSKIEENAYVAPGAIIKNQIVIGKNTIVGMGAVVTKDVGAGQTVAGVPAKPIVFSGNL